jgi:hypothetical protein
VTPEQLDRRADHVAFEVWALVEQIIVYIERHGPRFPSGSSTFPDEQALLEAALVHLRLLDEFLGCTGRNADDVKACDWPGWSPNGFLGAQRKAINAHVAHLSRRRRATQEWDLPTLGKAACVRLVEFFDVIPADRVRAFGAAPEIAAQAPPRFAAALAKFSGGNYPAS